MYRNELTEQQKRDWIKKDLIYIRSFFVSISNPEDVVFVYFLTILSNYLILKVQRVANSTEWLPRDIIYEK